MAARVAAPVWYPGRMEPTPEVTALRREVERPGTGGPGLVPVLVLAAAMTSTLAAAGLAMTMSPRARHCPRSGQMDRSMVELRGLAGRAPGAVRHADAVPTPAPIALDRACAPRVYHADGETQEWTFETCANAPMPRHFVVSQP